jgi:transitional endoplasmic reticulum ATPase
VAATPDDPALRRLLADLLAERGNLPAAEDHYREGLRAAPRDHALTLGLARVYLRTGRTAAAGVALEDLLSQFGELGDARVLLARILLAEGAVERAVEEYRRGVEADPTAADPELADRLGIDAPAGSEVSEGRVRAAADPMGDMAAIAAGLEKPRISFGDVGGMESLKEEIRLKIVHPLDHPELFAAYGKPVGGAILLYGPPGCGKTYLARATAGEVKATFLPVGINDVLDMWIGASERNLHEIFQTARRNSPCVLFFDEVDALAASRADMRTSAGRHVINQFLSELDGVEWSNEGVLILAATNAPWHLDSAFRRPGRFDTMVFVPPPDAEARVAILETLARDKPVADLDLAAVARQTEGFSGADLRGLVDRAVERKLAQAMKDGFPSPLTTNDLLAAAKPAQPTTREWFATARNYLLYANEAGAYDALKPYVKL